MKKRRRNYRSHRKPLFPAEFFFRTEKWKAANVVREVWFTRSMMPFNIFALDTYDFNIDMFECQVKILIREIFMKKKVGISDF